MEWAPCTCLHMYLSPFMLQASSRQQDQVQDPAVGGESVNNGAIEAMADITSLTSIDLSRWVALIEEAGGVSGPEVLGA